MLSLRTVFDWVRSTKLVRSNLQTDHSRSVTRAAMIRLCEFQIRALPVQRVHCIGDRSLLRALLGRVQPIHRGRRIARRLHDFELGANPARELTAEYRLGQEIADPDPHPFSARLQVVSRGNHDYRDL